MEKSEIAIRESIEQAERIAGTQVDQVFIGFSAGGMVSDMVDVEVGDRRRPHLGRRHRQSARQGLVARSSREGRQLLHALPAFYTIDEVNGVKQPRGLHAEKLGVNIHVITADPAPWKNLNLCVRSAHLGVEATVASPVAAGKACLSEEERELGVALVELGGGVTNVSVFAGGMLVGLKSLAIGGGDITDDIAAAFGTRRVEAERIKCFYGSAMTSPRDNHDMIELAPIAGGQEGVEASRITRAQLVSVIRQRLEHLTAQVEEALKALGFAGADRPADRAHRRRRRAEGDRRLCAGRARPDGADRPAATCRACPRRIAAPLSRLWPASPCSPRRARSTCAIGFGPKDSGEKASGNWLQRLIAAFRTQY